MTLIYIVAPWLEGKTTFATLLVLMAEPHNFKVYANYTIHVKNFIPLQVEHLIKREREPSLIVLDEGYTWLESRTSGNVLNRLVSHDLFQHRKLHSHYIVTAQLEHSVDNRFRELAEIIIKCKNIGEMGFKYTIYHVKTNAKTGERKMKKQRSIIIDLKLARWVQSKFDTLETVQSPNAEKLYVKNLSKESMLTICDTLAVKMLKIQSEWKLDDVKRYLRRNKQSTSYAKDVLFSIKDLQEGKGGDS